MPSDKSLKQKLVRLAYHNPALRPHLLPLLKEAKADDLKVSVQQLREVINGQIELLQQLRNRVMALGAKHSQFDADGVAAYIDASTQKSWIFLSSLGDIIKILGRVETQLRKQAVDWEGMKERLKSVSWIDWLKTISGILTVAVPAIIAIYQHSDTLIRYILNKPLSEDAQQDIQDLIEASEEIIKIPTAVNKAVSDVLSELGKNRDLKGFAEIEKGFRKIDQLSAPGSKLDRSMQLILTALSDEAKRMGRPR